MQSILVPAETIDSVEKRLERLARKCGVSVARVAGESRIYRKVAVRVKSYMGDTYLVHKVDPRQVIVCGRLTIGELPSVNGYSFVGKICHTEGGNIIAMAPGEASESIPAEWRSARPTCDHCATARKRNETFLIREPSGAVKRVGRNCLSDFTAGDGSAFIDVAAFEDSLLELTGVDEQDGDSLPGCHWGVDTFEYLCCVVSSVRHCGFFKVNNPQGVECTASHAMFIAGDRPTNDAKAKQWDELQPTDDDRVEAIGVMLWLDETTDQSDYMHNLKVAARCFEVTSQRRGLLASAPSAYGRAMGQVSAAKARAALPDAGYLGTVKQRLDLTVVVERVHTTYSDFGSSNMVVLKADNGADCVVFCHGSGPSTLDVGKKFKLRATVTKHAEYKGRKQTTLNRPVWTPVA